MDHYYQDPYGQYSATPLAYSNAASFGTADLGMYDGYNNSHSMNRVTSQLSHSSFDSAVHSDFASSPTALDSSSHFGFGSSSPPTTYSNGDYALQPSYSPAASPASYRTSATQAGVPRNTGGGGGYQSPQMVDQPPVTQQQPQPSSPVQQQQQQRSTGKPAEWRCLYKGCKQKPFRRHADLDRHLRHVHRNTTDSFFCDYRRCARSEASSCTTTTGGGGDDAERGGGRTPFSRWDHYKAHLRDYHKEPIPKRGGSGGGGGRDNSNINNFFDGRGFSSSWWRCSKCLRRNHLLADVDAGEGGGGAVGYHYYYYYKCGNCSQALEPAVVEERQRRFPGEAGARRRR